MDDYSYTHCLTCITDVYIRIQSLEPSKYRVSEIQNQSLFPQNSDDFAPEYDGSRMKDYNEINMKDNIGGQTANFPLLKRNSSLGTQKFSTLEEDEFNRDYYGHRSSSESKIKGSEDYDSDIGDVYDEMLFPIRKPFASKITTRMRGKLQK